MKDSTQLVFYRILTPMAALFFLFGAVGAILLGSVAAVDAAAYSASPPAAFVQALTGLTLLPILAYAFSFSSLGVFALPCLLIWLGYSRVLQTASLSTVYSFPSLLCMAGLPNLVAVPCVFAIAVSSFLFSLVRFRQVLGKPVSLRISRMKQLGVFLICLSVLSLCALCCAFVSPRLTALST